MWKKIKPQATKLVMWSIRNHWLLLVLLVVLQYLSGKVLTGTELPISLPGKTWFALHSLNGTLILLVAMALALEKFYLWLLRSGKV